MSISIIRKSEIVAGVPDAWKRQYDGCPQYAGYSDKAAITEALQALKGSDFTADQVNEIIGNKSWTENECDECGRDCEALVRIGQEPDYEARWVDVCRHCLTEALSLVSGRAA